MNRSLSAAELALFRARPQAARYYLAVHRPAVLFQAILSEVPTSFPGSEIRYTGVTSGAMAAVSAGATLRVGSLAGGSEFGTLRVRASATSPVIGVAEFGSGLIDWRANASLTILDEFLPWTIHPTYDNSASRWKVDFDLYTSQLERYGPLALLGPPMAAFAASNGKLAACYLGDWSQSLTPGVSITSQRWEFPDGQVVTSALGSSKTPLEMTHLNASPGGRYYSLTVTDSQGGSHVGRRLLFAFGSANQPHPVTFDEISGGLRSGGYKTRLYIHASGGSENFPDRAQVVVFESASYGTSGGSSISGNFPFRSSVVFVGWIEAESLKIEPFTGELSFEARTLDGLLEKTEAYDLFLQNANDGTAASDWDMAASLTLDRAAIALVKYRSTIAKVTDVHFAEHTASNTQIEYQSLPRGPLWAQLNQNYNEKGMLGLVAADLQSAIYNQLDAQISGASGSLPNVMAITAADRREAVVVERRHFDPVSEQALYGVTGVSPIGAISPGSPAGYFGGHKEIARGLAAPDQATLITWAGNLRARENNPFKQVVVPLAGNLRLDSVPQSRVTLSLSATDNLRGLALNNDVFLPYETRLRYDAARGAALTEVVLERSVNGLGGSAITFPGSGGSSVGPYPIVTLPPIELPPIIPIPDPNPPSTGENGANMLGLAIQSNDAGFVVATANFLDASPTWVDKSGIITGNPLVFRLDPWDPANNAYCLTTAGLWRTTNIRATTPTWTNVLTLAQMRSATYATAEFRALQLSITDQDYAALVVNVGSGSSVTWFGRTSNAPGGSGTWAWTALTEEANISGDGLYVSQRTTERIWISDRWTFNAVNGFGEPQIFYSNDGGASFTQYAVAIDANQRLVIFIPYGASSDDSIIYVGCNGGPGSKSGYTLRTSSGPTPTGFVGISPTLGGNTYGPTVGEGFTESPSSSGGNLYLMGGGTPGGADTALLKYDGSSWTTLQGPVTAQTWAGYGFGGWPSNNTQLQVHNAGFGAGKIGRSVDGGVTWIDRTGDLADLGVFTSVRWLVPIWTLP